MDLLASNEVTAEAPSPRGPNVWVALDAFGHHVIDQALASALRDVPGLARYNQLIRAAPNETLTSQLLDVIGTMLEQLASSAAREFAVVHLWLLYSQTSPVADEVPAWLQNALVFFDSVPVQIQVQMLTISLSWGQSEDERGAVERRLRTLEKEILAPGQVGHTRVAVFVITDRDHLAYKFSKEACWAAASHFATFALLTDAPRSRMQAVGRAFLSPTAAQQLIGVPGFVYGEPDQDGALAPDSVWGPFTSLAVAVRSYPVKELWMQRTAARQRVLDAVLQEEVPWQWIPDLPELILSDREDIPPGQACPEPPKWTPRHPFNRFREEYDARDLMEGWRELAETWREREPARFVERWHEIRDESTKFRAGFAKSDEEATQRLLRDAPYDGLFPLLERYLEHCHLRIARAAQQVEAGMTAGTIASDTSAASRPDPPQLTDPTPFVRQAQGELAAAIARRPDVRMLAGVTLVTGVISWYLIAQSLLFLQDSSIGWFDRLAARRHLPRLPLNRIEAALLLNPAFIRGGIAVLVGVVVGFVWWWVRHRSRRHLEEIYGTAFETNAAMWCDECLATTDAALRGSKVEDIASNLMELTAQIERRMARLEALRVEARPLTRPQLPPPPDPFEAYLDAASASPPEFHPTDARSVLRAFRTTETCLRWDDDQLSPADFFAQLQELAAMYTHDARPALRADLPHLIGQLRSAEPTVDEILVLPMIGRDRTPPWAITRMIAVPAGLEFHPALHDWGQAILALPVEERVYMLALRQGLQLVDLFAPSTVPLAATGGKL